MGKSWSPKATELADRFGLRLDRDVHISSDQRVHGDVRSAIEASQNLEQSSGGNQGTTGGCGQDLDNVPSEDKE